MDAFLRSGVIESRQDANLAIIYILTQVAKKFPDWRFHQILQNVEIIGRLGEDLFYEESLETLERMLNDCLVNSILSEEEL